jgi:hypothetical protein
MGWEIKNGHRYYVIHRKAFGEPKPIYGGSGEAGQIAEQAVLAERAAWKAIRDETLEVEQRLNECEAKIKELVDAELVRRGYVYTKHRRWILASKMRGPRGPYKCCKPSI